MPWEYPPPWLFAVAAALLVAQEWWIRRKR